MTGKLKAARDALARAEQERIKADQAREAAEDRAADAIARAEHLASELEDRPTLPELDAARQKAAAAEQSRQLAAARADREELARETADAARTKAEERARDLQDRPPRAELDAARRLAAGRLLSLGVLANRANVVAQALSEGARVNAPDEVADLPPLYVAAAFGRPVIVKQLLDAGADRSLKNPKGLTALDKTRERLSGDVADDLRKDLHEVIRILDPAAAPDPPAPRPPSP